MSNELLGEPLKGCERPEDLLGDSWFMIKLKIRLMERMLGAELTAHPGDEASSDSAARTGQSPERDWDEAGERLGRRGTVAVLRDQDGSFERKLAKKGQTLIHGIVDKFIGLYGTGLSLRDSHAHPEELCGLQVSPALISRVAAAVLDEVPK